MSEIRDAFICDAVRTPIGRYGGVLAHVRADDLAALPIQALMARLPNVDWARVDDVYYGATNQAGEDNRDIARMALLLAGLPDSIPGVTVNRLCSSGLEAVGQAARAIRLGEADLVIAGGAESLSRAPYVMPKAFTPFSRAMEVHDTTLGWRFINPKLKAQYGVDIMPETAENVAAEFKVSREDQDLFALRSQLKAAKAIAEGYFAEEIVAVDAKDARGKPTKVTVDEHPRPDTTLEGLAALPTPFRQPGTVTAGNASGLNDGAAALILASEAGARANGLTVRARVLGMAAAGVPPRIMGIGPIPSTQKLLARLGLAMSDFDVIELNEAFAAQGLAVTRGLGLADDDPRVNPNGGAIALGHPLGMSGARLALTAVHELEKSRGRRALCTLCIGVGQGLTVALERV